MKREKSEKITKIILRYKEPKKIIKLKIAYEISWK